MTRQVLVDADLLQVLLAAVCAPGCNAGDIASDPDILQEAVDELGIAADLADGTDPTAQLAWTAAAEQLRRFTAADAALNTESSETVAWLRDRLLTPYFERYGLDPADGRTAVGALAALLAAMGHAEIIRSQHPGWAPPSFDRHLAQLINPLAMAIVRAAPAEVRTP